jgi:hypothetical protein
MGWLPRATPEAILCAFEEPPDVGVVLSNNDDRVDRCAQEDWKRWVFEEVDR